MSEVDAPPPLMEASWSACGNNMTAGNTLQPEPRGLCEHTDILLHIAPGLGSILTLECVGIDLLASDSLK